MIQSLKYSHLIIRLGLAFVFLWFGIDKFIHPDYWINAWVPERVLTLVSHIGFSGREFMYLQGIFEVLIATSLLSTLFIRVFSAAAIVFLIVVFVINGFNQVLVRDVGLLSGFLALLMWPDRRFT
ncbi:MAG: DoxX family membrane protein [Candidatus Yanofskybacteria bacterium]|nr:DoxX family membrane protein [Candidatus Yanofskybacteria bacterium]